MRRRLVTSGKIFSIERSGARPEGIFWGFGKRSSGGGSAIDVPKAVDKMLCRWKRMITQI